MRKFRPNEVFGSSSSEDLKRRSVKAVAFTAGTGAIDFFIRFGSTALLARLVSPEHWGLVMMSGALIAVADQFRDLGLTTATVQRHAISNEEASNSFWLGVLIAFVLFVLFCASAPLIATYYKDDRVTLITSALAFNLVLGSLTGQHQALLTRQLRLGEMAMVRLFSSVLSTLLAIVLAYHNFGAWALVFREFSRWLFIAIGMWFIMPWIPSRPDFSTSIRDMLGYGMNLTGAHMLGVLSGTMDRFLLGRLWGPDSVASYRQGHQLLSAPADQVVSPIYQAAQPALSRLQSDPLRFRNYYLKTLKVVCILTMPSSVFLGLFSKEIAHIFLGPKWHSVGPVIAILAIGVFAKQTISSSALVLFSLGRMSTYLKLSAYASATSIALAVAGSRYGLYGLAIADVCSIFLMAAPRLVWGFRDSPVSIHDFLRAILAPSFSSIAMVAVLFPVSLWLDTDSSAIRLILFGIVGPVVFLGSYSCIPEGRTHLLSLFDNLRELRGRGASRNS